MRTMWLSIAACGVLLCWTVPMPRLRSPAKPPPPCQTCYPEPDAGNEEDASANTGNEDAGVAIDASTTDGSAPTLSLDASTPVTTGDAAAAPDTEGLLKGSCACDVPGARSGPSTWEIALALAVAASAVRRRRGRG
jgi:hypothetical protein